MGRFVSEERHLCEHDAQRSGDQQLEPAVPEQDEAGHAAREGDGQGHPHQDVEPARPLEKTSVADHLQDLHLRAEHGREARLVDVGLSLRPVQSRTLGEDGRHVGHLIS